MLAGARGAALRGVAAGVWRSARSAAARGPAGRRPMSSGAGGQDLNSLGAEELRKMVSELQAKLGAAGEPPAAPLAPEMARTEAPESYLRPTKGESSDLKNITIVELQRMREKGIPITMATAYDFPSAVHVDLAGIDVVLVGDSVGMVVLGYETTLPVSFEEILHHCRAVSRGCRRPLLVGDMPFGSYEISPCAAQQNAYRLLKEGGMEAVKLEGCDPSRLKTVQTLVNGGIAVMGHIGLTPQSYSTLGGFRAQGRHAKQAIELIENAKRLEDAGVFAMVIECVPEEVAQALTEAVSVPTIGIGAGGSTSGQVLVYHDLLGMMQHPHHAKVTPKFCKQYCAVGATINEALRAYAAEVRSGAFPGEKFSPYKMAKGEHDIFSRMLQDQQARLKPGKALGGWGRQSDGDSEPIYGSGDGRLQH